MISWIILDVKGYAVKANKSDFGIQPLFATDPRMYESVEQMTQKTVRLNS